MKNGPGRRLRYGTRNTKCTGYMYVMYVCTTCMYVWYMYTCHVYTCTINRTHRYHKFRSSCVPHTYMTYAQRQLYVHTKVYS